MWNIEAKLTFSQKGRNPKQLQTEANNWAGDRYESRVAGGDIYYSYSNAYPQVFNTADIRLVSYFDDYDSWRLNDMLFDGANAYHTQISSHAGLATGGRSRNSENGNWLVSVNYYDNKQRAIQAFSHNVYGNIERTDYKYDFAGEAMEIRYLMRDAGNNATIQLERFDYDQAGRKTAYKLGMNAVGETIATYEYDEIGRLKTKKFYPDQTFTTGGALDYINRPPSPNANIEDVARKAIYLNEGTTIDAAIINTYSASIVPIVVESTEISGLQTIDYSYQIRGALRGINLDGSGNPVPNATQGDLFSYKLDYETAGFYDGNIGKQSWQSVENNSLLGLRAYTYNYDPVSRLKSATYAGINGEDYSLPNLSYDKNGNITNLQRKGKNGGSFGDIDNLSYTYNGNRLLGVTDGVNGNEDVGDFRDNGSNSDHSYWNDGSLKSDGNKGVSLINYDSYIRRIKQIDFSNGNWVKFFYDGNGTLLKRSNSLGEIWDYTTKGIYKNNSLYQFSQNEGRVVWNGNAFVYEFEYRDIWNNLRSNFKDENGQLVTTQKADYDMLGLELKTGQNGTNNFRFQQQERLFDFGLNWDLFKYRPSDSQIGRFIQIDPLAEKYVYNSTYALQENKFGLGVELEGKELKEWQMQYKPVPDNERYRLTPTNELKGFIGVSGEAKTGASVGFLEKFLGVGSGVTIDFGSAQAAKLEIGAPTDGNIFGEDGKAVFTQGVEANFMGFGGEVEKETEFTGYGREKTETVEKKVSLPFVSLSKVEAVTFTKNGKEYKESSRSSDYFISMGETKSKGGFGPSGEVKAEFKFNTVAFTGGGRGYIDQNSNFVMRSDNTRIQHSKVIIKSP